MMSPSMPRMPRVRAAIYFLTAYFFVAANTLAQTPQLIGRTGCATATCHGGLIGDGPIWHSSASRWEASDPHRLAGEVLLSELSRHIVLRLEPKASGSPTMFADVLKNRCVSCHAPETSLIEENLDVEASFRKQLARGVGCESCHGPASIWEKLHTQQDWEKVGRFDSSVGMLETEPLLQRVENCSRCHVGSRGRGGAVRDMNHDMIASGHPALTFEMGHYEGKLPAHWDETKSIFNPGTPTMLINRAAAAETRVLLCAAKLALDRIDDATLVPQPEFSEYDCAACHHSIDLGLQSLFSPIGKSALNGLPRWNPWLTYGYARKDSADKLRMGSSELKDRLLLVAKESEELSHRLLAAGEIEPLAYLSSSLRRVIQDERLRKQILVDASQFRAWLHQIEVACRASALVLDANQRKQMESVLPSYRLVNFDESNSVAAYSLTHRLNIDSETLVLFCQDLLRVFEARVVP